MSFLLIKQAVAFSKLTGEQQATASQLKPTLQKAVLEAVTSTKFSITPNHYTQWLSLLLNMAHGRKISVSKKAAFEDLAQKIAASVKRIEVK
jgi:hypothetical protein